MGKSDDRLTPSWVAASSEDLMTTLWLGIHMLESKKFLAAFVAGDAKAAEIHLANADAALTRVGRVGKILEIHQEDPGRIHVVLIRQTVGF
jgi:hypothetical protein